MPKIITVSDAVRGTKVDLDGKGLRVEQIVDMPMPQIAAKIPEVVETIPQEHMSDDLPVPQVVKENLEVIKVPQEREDVPQMPEETVELVKLVSQERVQQRTVEETVELVKLVSQERAHQWTAEVPMPHSEEEAVAVVGLSPRERVQHRTAEQIEDIPQVREETVGLKGTRATANCRCAKALRQKRIFEQGGVIEIPETAGEDRRLQRTVVQYLDVSAEVDKNVLQERTSEGMRDQISREHLQCFFKLLGLGCMLS